LPKPRPQTTYFNVNTFPLPNISILQDPVGFYLIAAVLGLCVGSFLNVLIYRLPKMLDRAWQQQAAELRGEPMPDEFNQPFNLVVPRSACPNCGHQIKAIENIPIISWLVLRGRCAECGAPISRRYPIVEFLGAALAVLAAWHFGPTWEAVAAWGFLWLLLALAFIDYDTMLLPDDLTLPLLWAGLTVNLFGLYTSVTNALLGAVVGYLLLWLVYWVFKLLRNKEGMGYGDFKLLAAMGAWMGWEALLPIILISSVLGMLVGLGLILLKGRDHNIPMPFGPFLAIAGGITLFAGHFILSYLLPPFPVAGM
jgi:leader peptidase (prepilin peptidase)/N-methyltransferase